MSEQSSASDSDEPSVYTANYLRTPITYDENTRLQMAGHVAVSRRLYVSAALQEVMNIRESFHHGCQQSASMLEDAKKRRILSCKTKREAHIEEREAKGLDPLKDKIQEIVIDPTKVTLSLEFESQYYPLMTNDYGDLENVASIMNETNTLIQFPDAPPRNSTTHDPFVQQITITGDCVDVDRARKLMRDNCHFSVYMSLSKLKVSLHELQMFVDHNQIENVELYIHYLQIKNAGARPSLRLTSRSKNASDLVNAAKKILDELYQEGCDQSKIFSLYFQLSKFHKLPVLGKDKTKTKGDIEKISKAKMLFYMPVENILVICIHGSIESVLKARELYIELLPVSLCFNAKNSQLRFPRNTAESRVFLDKYNVQLRVATSIYQPTKILEFEEPIHCVRLVSKEFYVGNIYLTYEKLLSTNINANVPKSNDYEKSIWIGRLPKEMFIFPLPCRGDLVVPSEGKSSEGKSSEGKSTESKSTGSTSSIQSKTKNLTDVTNTIIPRANAQIDLGYVTQLQPITDAMYPYLFFTNPNHFNTHVFRNHMVQQQQQQIQQPPIYYLGPTNGMAEPAAFTDMHRFVPIELREAGRFEPGLQFPPQQFYREPQSSGSRASSTASAQFCSSPSPQNRAFDQPKEENPRFASKPGSRRSSVNCDEPTAGSCEDRYSDYSTRRQFSSRPPKGEHINWKSGGRGDTQSRKNPSFHRDFRGVEATRPRDSKHFEGHTQSEQSSFQMSQNLKLKSQEMDLDQERLFTHDTSLTERQMFTPTSGSYGNDGTEDSPLRQRSNSILTNSQRRSRTTSCFFDKDDQNSRFTDSDCACSVTDQASTHQSRSIDSFSKKMSGVTKTMLEPRTRNERDYGKISLQHKDKHFNDHQRHINDENSMGNPSLGTNQFRMDPMQLIAKVRDSSDQLPRIHERQFSDVLNDKERDMAALSLKNRSSAETTIVQEPSFEESSSLNKAFRSERSLENIQPI